MVLQLCENYEQILLRNMKASVLIVVVLLIRYLFRKAPCWTRCLLWLIVFVQLMIPIKLESKLSAYNYIPDNNPVTVYYEIISERQEQQADLIVTPENLKQREGNDSDMAGLGLMLVWIIGVVTLGVYFIANYVRLRFNTRAAIPYRDNIYLCDKVKSPFILGLFRVKIMLSSSIDEKNIVYVVAHEKAHIKRKDQWWKLIGYVTLAVHWMNPLVWVAYILFCKDIELACDETVIKDNDMEFKKSYSLALLDCSMQKNTVLAGALAFGEVGIKERVSKVLNYKKPTLWVIVGAVIICVIISITLLTSPRRQEAVIENKADDTSFSKEVAELIVNDNDKFHSDASKMETDDTIHVVTPKINLAASTGADGSYIYYADDNKFIFAGYYGLFIYNTDNKQLIRGVDLNAIGCDKTQGDEACEISVNKDGTEVYLHKIMSDKLYVYHVIENVITEERFELNNDDLFADISGAHSGKMISYSGDTGLRTISLVNDTQIGELGYTYDELSSFRKIFGNGDYIEAKIPTIQAVPEKLRDCEFDNCSIQPRGYSFDGCTLYFSYDVVGDKDVVEDVFVDSVQNSLETIYFISSPGEERTVMRAIIRYNSYRPECDIIVSKKGSDKTFEYNIVQTDEDGVFTAFLTEDDENMSEADDIQFLDIPYEEIDGQYVSNGKSYKYKLTLIPHLF